ncbi:beta-xylosidase [Halobacteroides halobius DSM 5150]|uniref:Beta-xylosidase n=1 Tax=Halobacteroides halobius (strain ATCC 35273 / DSM 5150 / MD-1) TaxID=748449 RepID=L0KB98_HALHC|nr:glycoside hydrolase family 43 protein [Halobacteroides halobius]AGB41659.1 beta-xylosidase [Halobacteroides halobius DSM 5150]
MKLLSKKLLIICLLLSLVSVLGACSSDDADTANKVPLDPNSTAVHDPSVIKVNNTYWVFGSHLASGYSNDLISWEQYSSHVHDDNPLIPNVTEKLSAGLNWAQTNTLWAPDVIQLKADGKYYMYYNMCEGSSPRSALGVAVADNVDGPYKKKQLLLKSGMAGDNQDGTLYDAEIYPGEYHATQHPNVVDPDVFYDQNGKLWMVYGSYSGGIFILELDPATGMPKPGQGYGKKLLGGNHSRIEAPYVLYSPKTDYYYLFLSYGGLASDGGYNIRVARSKNPDGPYYDVQGHNMINAHGDTAFDDEAIEPYGAKLIGNFKFFESNLGYVSPGHNSAYYNQETRKMYVIFHTRYPGHGERHQVRSHQMLMNSKDWPVITPHNYTGEDVGVYSESDVVGTYQYVNHGKDIQTGDGNITKSKNIKLLADGTITGAVEGTWELTGDYTVNITINGNTYYGVFLEQLDRGLRENVMTFSALSNRGVTIWGSQIPQ